MPGESTLQQHSKPPNTTMCTNLSDDQRLSCTSTLCFLKLGLVQELYFFWPLHDLKFVSRISFIFLVRSFFDIQDVGDDWLKLGTVSKSTTKLQLTMQLCYVKLHAVLRLLLSFSLSPLMIVVNPTSIIVFAFKFQLACRYSIGSSFQTRSREQRETTASREMFYTNISILD